MKGKQLVGNSEIWMVLSVVLNICLLGKTCGEHERLAKHIISTRKDTLWNDDTTYIVKSKIDTAYYDPNERDYQSDQY